LVVVDWLLLVGVVGSSKVFVEVRKKGIKKWTIKTSYNIGFYVG